MRWIIGAMRSPTRSGRRTTRAELEAPDAASDPGSRSRRGPREHLVEFSSDACRPYPAPRERRAETQSGKLRQRMVGTPVRC
jgi:hypothetical protein